MSKLPLVLRELHRAETDLARDLLALADRHRAEHEVFHVARDVAVWSQIHVRRLAEIAPDYGARLNPTSRWTRPHPLPDLVRGLAARLRRRPEPGLLLLANLRHLHRTDRGDTLPSLVVCPVSVLGNWARETARFAPGVRVLRYHGERRTLARVPAGGIVLPTYTMVRREMSRLARSGVHFLTADATN